MKVEVIRSKDGTLVGRALMFQCPKCKIKHGEWIEPDDGGMLEAKTKIRYWERRHGSRCKPRR